MTTLAFERAGVIMMASRLEQDVLDLVAGLADRDLAPGIRLDLTDRLVEARLLGLLGRRALGRIADGGSPGPEHSVIKLAWSAASQHIGETHLARAGRRRGRGALRGRRAARLPALPGLHHRRRHHRDHAQHPGRTGPGHAPLIGTDRTIDRRRSPGAGAGRRSGRLGPAHVPQVEGPALVGRLGPGSPPP
jgi:hypothetical protein